MNLHAANSKQANKLAEAPRRGERIAEKEVIVSQPQCQISHLFRMNRVFHIVYSRETSADLSYALRGNAKGRSGFRK